MDLKFKIARALEELDVDAALWNALVRATPGATVFQTYQWFACWWRAFGTAGRLFVVTAWRGDQLAAIAPLMRRPRHGLRQLEFVGSPSADYMDLILGPDPKALLPDIARFLFEQRTSWDVIVLRNVPVGSATFEHFGPALRRLGLGVTDGERVPCPTLLVSSRPAEIRELLHGYSLRRRFKALRRHGHLTYRRLRSAADVDASLPRFFDQLARRGRAAGAASRATVESFLRDLSMRLLHEDWLHFTVLECGGRPVAFHFGFEFGGRLYWYKPSFDPAMGRESPGVALLGCLIRDAQESGLDELDFTVGAEAFKYRYANAERQNANLRIFSGRLPYAAALAIAWGRRTAGQLQRLLRAGTAAKHTSSR